MSEIMKPRLLIFASGSKEGGGSGFLNLVNASRDGRLNAEIVAVVSNHDNGGVREKADRLGIKFIHFSGPWEEKNYQQIVSATRADFVALSGWLKLVSGLDPRTTFNIHPGPLPRFGGKGMYGHHVHEAVMDSFKRGEVTKSAVTMHFVTPKYDEGPIFFEKSVRIEKDDTPDTLARRVNQAEHEWQPLVTNKVLSGEISWDGRDRYTLKGIMQI